MSGNNRFIRIAQQPPAIVSRGEIFNFIAYFAKSSPYEYHQEDVQLQDANNNSLGEQASFPTYRSGGFATTSVIPTEGTKITLSSSLEKWNDRIVIGSGRRADFNRTNEDDRTIRFELGIKCTGKFIVVVRLHRQHKNALRVSGKGSETWPSSIVTSVVTRTIQVVERKEEDDTRSKHARYGRLTPPPMDRVEEKPFKSSHVDGRKPLPTDTGFNGRRDTRRRGFLIMARPKDANLTEKEGSGSNIRKGKENKPNLHVSAPTPYDQQNVRYVDSEPGEESWNNDGNNMGANLPSHGRLTTPRPNSTLQEEKKTDGDIWSDDDDSDDEGGVKLF